jgi:hypothetical protein
MPGGIVPHARVVLAFREFTNAEIKLIMKNAVDDVYALLSLRDQGPEKYEAQMRLGERYTATWDDPELPRGRRA